MSKLVDLKDDPTAFRGAVREWLNKALPVDWRARHREDSFKFERWWFNELLEVGLATPHWPAEFGGADLNLASQVIVADEIARADGPDLKMYIVALTHVPATLLRWGTGEQKANYLPSVSRRGEVWCQGFSEPSAGSDLASLRTSAFRDGDEYVVNGQKIWSSGAMFARYCLLLARTDSNAKKHAGISYFILDMQTAGVEPRPIKQATGESEFCELFLTDVRVPARDRIGAEGQGWEVAQSTLSAERGVYGYGITERLCYRVQRFYSEAVCSKADWLEDDQLRREFMTLFGRMQALRRMTRRVLEESEHAPSAPSMMPVFVKLIGTDLHQQFADLLVRIAGINAQELADEGPLFDFIASFGLTISAGTNEIMRNIVAERGLGMPR